MDSPEAIQKIVDLAPPTTVDLHGMPWATRALTLIAPPQAPEFTVGTLDGFVNLLEAGIDSFDVEKTVIHIGGFDSVSLVDRVPNEFGKRPIHAQAHLTFGLTTFPYFNNWGAQEDFIIGLQSHFQANADLTYLLDLASHITAKEQIKQVDSGVTQEVTLQRGSVFKETIEAKARLTLKPFRTFRELDQPASDFIFRVRDGAKLALFEGDGGAWKIAAIGLIQEWLNNRIHTSSNAALANLPIIS